MGEVFIKILNMSLTAGLIVLAVLLVRLLFQKKAPKALFPILWAIVAVRLVCPVVLESRISLIPNTKPMAGKMLFSEKTETVDTSTYSVTTSPEEAKQIAEEYQRYIDGLRKQPEKIVVSVVSGPVETGNPEEADYFIQRIDPEETVLSDEIMEELKAHGTYTETTEDGVTNTYTLVYETTLAKQKPSVYEILAVIWIIGVAGMLFYMMFSYLRVYRRVKESAPEEKHIRICDGIDSPFILGLVRPKIYLPSDLSEQDKMYVIAHERAHLKRFDHIWKPLGFLLLSVYWFHPLLWVAYILLCKDIEYACDEKVMKELGQEHKKNYSTALINCSVPKRMISACPLAFGENGVKGRVTSVLHYKKPAFWIVIVSILVGVVMAVCFLTNPKEDSAPEKQEISSENETDSGDVSEIVKRLPERYNYNEIKSLLLEYLNHQAWLYPSEYPQESYTCSYEIYCMTSDSIPKRVFIKAFIKGSEYWFDFQQEDDSLPDSPVRIVEREPQVKHYIEEGFIESIGNDNIHVPAVKRPVYEKNVDFTEEISYIYAELKKNGYRDDLRIEAIVSACDMEKKLYPYVYLIINDSQVYETSFTDEYTLSRTFDDENYYIDYSLNYGTGNPWLFDGHGIKPLGSVDAGQFARVKESASFHKILKEDTTEDIKIDGAEVSVPRTNMAINEETGVGIVFLPQRSLSDIMYYNIYRSEDNGNSWRMIAEDFSATEADIAKILIPEKDTIVCYFDISGTTSQSSCQISEDGGVTWNYAQYPSKPNSFRNDPQKGSSVIFGAYEQDGDISNGAEPLEWFVLDRDGDRALLLTKYGIETLLYDKSKSVHPWSDSELYRIINRKFYQYAFSEEERAALIQTDSIKDKSLALIDDMERLFYHGYTFLPETDTVLYGKAQDGTAFFRTEESRITIPTAYAAQKGAWIGKDGKFSEVAAPWLLIVTGTTDGDFKEVTFARVMEDGSISFEEEVIKDEYVMIRPAIWVDVTKIPQ